jgi:hypothetical protein
MKIPGIHSCKTLSGPPQVHSASGRIRSIEKSNYLIGNRTSDLLVGNIVPQPTALPSAYKLIYLRKETSNSLLLTWYWPSESSKRQGICVHKRQIFPSKWSMATLAECLATLIAPFPSSDSHSSSDDGCNNREKWSVMTACVYRRRDTNFSNFCIQISSTAIKICNSRVSPS